MIVGGTPGTAETLLPMPPPPARHSRGRLLPVGGWSVGHQNYSILAAERHTIPPLGGYIQTLRSTQYTEFCDTARREGEMFVIFFANVYLFSFTKTHFFFFLFTFTAEFNNGV